MSKKTIYKAGDKVFIISENKLATVLNVYGNGEDGHYGEIRLDMTGNTAISDIEKYESSKHSAFDDTFIPIKAKWKSNYKIKQDIPLRDS
jgi:hypothetical protein